MSKESLLQRYRARQAMQPAADMNMAMQAEPNMVEQQPAFRYEAALPGALATGAASAYPLIGLPSLLMRGAQAVGETLAPIERAAGAPGRYIRGLFGMPEEEAPPEWAQKAVETIQQAPQSIGQAVSELFGGTGAPETRAQRFAVAGTQAVGGALPGLLGIPGALPRMTGTVSGELGVSALSGLASQAAQEGGYGPVGQTVAGMLPYLLTKSTTGKGAIAERSVPAIRQQRGFAVRPDEPLPKSAIAAALQQDLKAARQATAAPISAEFERIIGTLQDQPIMVRRSQYRDLINSTQQLLDYLRTSVPKELQELILNSPSGPTGARSVAEGLRPFEAAMVRGEVPATLNARQLYDFSEAVQSVINKVKAPGDKRSLFQGIKQKADALLERVGPEYENLQKARADWAKLKRTYDSNPLIGRFLKRDIDPEAALEAITSGTRAKYIRDALGPERMSEFQNLLVDELTRLGNAAESLAKLKANEKYKFALGDVEYNKLKGELSQAARQEKLTSKTIEWIDKTLGGKGTNAIIIATAGVPAALTKIAVKEALERVGTRLSTFQLNKLMDALQDPNVLRFLMSQTQPATEAPSAVPAQPAPSEPSRQKLSPLQQRLLQRHRERQPR